MGDVVTPLIVIGMIIMGVIWGIVNWTIDDSIRVSEPIQPTIELVIKNNQVDTIYTYRKP